MRNKTPWENDLKVRDTRSTIFFYRVNIRNGNALRTLATYDKVRKSVAIVDTISPTELEQICSYIQGDNTVRKNIHRLAALNDLMKINATYGKLGNSQTQKPPINANLSDLIQGVRRGL